MRLVRPRLLQWQWSDYPAKHRDRTNLVLHIFAVPLFDVATIALIVGVAVGSGRAAGLALLLASATDGPAQAKKIKVAIVLPGVITDKAWNELGHKGIKTIEKELGAEIAFVEEFIGKITGPQTGWGAAWAQFHGEGSPQAET